MLRFTTAPSLSTAQLSASTASTVWTLPSDLAQSLTTLHRATPPEGHSILGDLITAAWRLPWSSISHLFSLISDSTTTDAETLRPIIRSHLQSAHEAGTIIPEDEVPPPVSSVDSRSVASFPLQVSHADAYLGSSLLQSASSVSSPTASPLQRLAPANLVDSALTLLGISGSSGTDANTAHGRTALVGDAAHSIHPLAGQGLNLGLRDVRVLSEELATACASGSDWGSHDALRAYERRTYAHNQVVLSAVDHLHWLYAAPVPSALQSQSQSQSQVANDGTATATAAAATGQSALLGGLGRNLAREAIARSVLWTRSTGLEVLNEADWIKDRIQRAAGSNK